MKYYWCANCGYHGIFDFFRERNAKCKSCDYDALTPFKEEELADADFMERHERDKTDSHFDGKLKYAKQISKNTKK